jgi:hypothetical protein
MADRQIGKGGWVSTNGNGAWAANALAIFVAKSSARHMARDADRNGDVAAASLLELDRRSRPAVISRTVVLSRRSDFADSRTAISQPSGRH